MQRGLALLVACLALPMLASAQDRTSPNAAPGDGDVYVYLQPVGADANRLVFTVASLGASTTGGADLPLELSLTTITPSETRRQRLLAIGRVPAGNYKGLSLGVRKATLRRDSGEAALLVPDAPVTVDVPFLVTRGGAVVVWLTLDAAASLADVSFTPAVSGVVPARPNAGRAGFASTPRSNSVTIFDKQSLHAAVVVPTAAGPSGMALDQRLGRLYVACARDDEIQVLDVAAAQVLERARLVAGDGPREIALTPDGRTLLSANANSNSIGVFDTMPLTRLDRIGVGNGPGSIAIDQTGRRAFVFNTLSNSISVVDIARRQVVATIATDAPPLRGAFSLRGDRLYVLHERSPYLTILDPVQLTVISRSRLRIGLETLAVDPRRGVLYMSGRNETLVEFYDPNTLLPMGSLATRAGVSHLVVDAEENALYMASTNPRRVLAGRLADRKVGAEVDVGEAPYWVSVMGER